LSAAAGSWARAGAGARQATATSPNATIGGTLGLALMAVLLDNIR
jgi:hypothetical protein